MTEKHFSTDTNRQRAALLAWLQTSTITTLQARKELDILYPAARIQELRDQGHKIVTHWATGASLHESTGRFTVVALDAGNLEMVALVFRCLYPNSRIVICGDNDESGVGQKAARAAAVAVGGKYILPVTVGHDWNDALNMEVV